MLYLIKVVELYPLYVFFALLAMLGFLSCLYLALKLYNINRDVNRLSDSLRILLRSGRSPEGMQYQTGSVEGVWRRIVSYYAGIVKDRDSQNDISQILTSSRGIVESSSDDEKILEVLCEVLYKSASPEVVFVGAAIRGGTGWNLCSSVGISKRRLEDPFIIACDKLPLEYREAIYTQSNNGIEFDFRALGVGLSLFVPLKTEFKETIGVVWLGFSEHSGAIPESRKHTLELIAQHASASYVQSRERNRSKKIDEKKKEEMLALSHDMKAPGTRALYAIRELDTLLEVRGLIEEKNLAQEVEYALVEQVNLIDKLFNVEVINSEGKHVVSSTDVEIGSLVKSRIAAFRILAKSVGLELAVFEMVKAKARISKDVLVRVLDNLISNSIKYTHSGVIEVAVLGSGSTVRIEVRDSGMGVDEELRKVLFSSLIRNAKQVNQQGHRYGLTVVRTLVEEMGGSVGYLPNVPKGSIFYLELPASNIIPLSDRGSSYPQVLVIDDDCLVRSTHERWLSSIGTRAYGVSTFRDALDHLAIKKPDYILTDFQLPGEEIERFLELLPSDIEVIVVSGRSESYIRDKLVKYHGVIAVLEKPINKTQLRDLITPSGMKDSKQLRRRAA